MVIVMSSFARLLLLLLSALSAGIRSRRRKMSRSVTCCCSRATEESSGRSKSPAVPTRKNHDHAVGFDRAAADHRGARRESSRDNPSEALLEAVRTGVFPEPPP